MRVLDFRSYHSINEEKEDAVTAIEQIVNLFFQAYGGLVTKIGDYPDAAKDLMEIAKEKAPKKVGQVFVNLLTKIAEKVDPKYKEAADQVVLAGKKMKEAFDAALKTEEGYKDLDKVKEGIYDKIIAYLESLKKTAKEAQKDETAGGAEDAEEDIEDIAESWNSEEQSSYMILEKANTFRPEREAIAADITPQLAQARDLAKNPATPGLGSKFKEVIKKFEDILKEVAQENRPYWVDMSRKERLDRLEAIRGEVAALKTQLYTISMDGVRALGLDKNITQKIKEAGDLIASSIKLLDAVDKEEAAKKMEDEKKKEEEDQKEEDKKDEEDKDDADDQTFIEIKSGNKEIGNLQKKGKNRDAIRKAQEMMNNILPVKDKIKADGLFGGNTETAIGKISDMYSNIQPDLKKAKDTNTLTPEFQKFIYKFEKNKDKVKELFT